MSNEQGASAGSSPWRRQNDTVRPSIVIRPPAIRRIGGGIALVLVGLLWLPAMLSVDPAGALAVYGFFVFCAVNSCRWSLGRVEVRGDELHVRNWVRNEVFRRDEVVGFARVELDGRPRGSRILTLGELSQIGVKVRGPRVILLNASLRGPIDTTSVDSWLEDLQKWQFSASADLGAGNDSPPVAHGTRPAEPFPRARSSVRGPRPGGRKPSDVSASSDEPD
ncbi:MAG: hypothetical protein ACKO27_08920 [Ilumatobacteraceae bacterium]